MRETRGIDVAQSFALRITPAYAGNTECDLPSFEHEWDHPRVCGKHLATAIRTNLALGSPPRIRETRCKNRRVKNVNRITPAYAGNTRNLSKSFKPAKDHPRVCGKHGFGTSYSCCFSGSPPRMRETLLQPYTGASSYRITPAYAGNTIIVDGFLLCLMGSPPRMRETLNKLRVF